jgi:hypothetical protein
MREKEIEQTFKNNPDLLSKSTKQLALYFYIQGELASSHMQEIERQRANFYRYRLHALDSDLGKRCDQVLKDALSDLDPNEVNHLQRIK